MKLFQVLVVVSVIYAAYGDDELSEDDKIMIRPHLEKCKKDEGASDQQLEDFLDKKNRGSDIFNCMAACTMEQFTIIEKQGDGTYKISPDNVESMAKMKTQDENELKKIRQVADNCISITNPERCAYAADLIDCMEKQIKESK